MLSDAPLAPVGLVIETDICLVGAGAAGIAIPREFALSNQFQLRPLTGRARENFCCLKGSSSLFPVNERKQLI